MNSSYNELLSKLESNYCSNKYILDEKMMKMLNYLISDTTKKEYNNLADRIITQYEETKEDVTFGIVIESINNYLLTYLLIFEQDKTYSNILLKKYNKDKLLEAKKYFMELKDMIVNNNKDKLSKLIIDKL